MATELEPMGVGRILGTAFALYKRRFVPFLALSLTVYVPFAVLMMLALSVAERSLGSIGAAYDSNLWNGTDLLGAPPDTLPPAPPIDAVPAFSLAGALASFVILLGGAVVFLSFVYPLCTGALTVSLSELYLGREIGAIEAYRRSSRRLGTLLFSQSLAAICILVGLLLCLIPGVLCSLWFMLGTPVVLLEDHGASASLARSRRLMAGNLAKGGVLDTILLIIGLLVSFAVRKVVGYVPWPAPFVGEFLADLGPALVLPFSTCASVLLYYDVRIRREGFGLPQLAERMKALGEG